MIPFFIIYSLLLIGCSGALRVTTSTTTKSNDPVLGNVWRVMLTLEEATHGPDVQWRNIIFSQPAVASIIFLFFLWAVAILLLNLLIAMFSFTFEDVREHAHLEYHARRALRVVTADRLFTSIQPKGARCLGILLEASRDQ